MYGLLPLTDLLSSLQISKSERQLFIFCLGLKVTVAAIYTLHTIDLTVAELVKHHTYYSGNHITFVHETWRLLCS